MGARTQSVRATMYAAPSCATNGMADGTSCTGGAPRGMRSTRLTRRCLRCFSVSRNHRNV
eukprot:4052598-Prorocentrum_lima.AAC.1